MRAWFDGDFGRLLAAAEAFVDTPTGSWDMQVRGLRSLPAGAARRADRRIRSDLTGRVVADAARRSGFHRLHWTMLGMAALCRALQGRDDEAAALIDELAGRWSAVPALASGEWIAAAAYAAALAGRDAAVRVRAMLDRVGHRTPWSEAALRTVTAALAAADGDHRRAAELHLAAAETYARIPDVSDRMLALALAAAELTRAGDPAGARTPRPRCAPSRCATTPPACSPGRSADQPDGAAVAC